MSDPIIVNIPDNDNVMYINGNTLAEIIDGQEHHDLDVIIQIPIFDMDNPQDLLDWINQRRGDDTS